MQILLCLLIAGIIGLVIGWLLRGSCKNKLLENDNKWNAELDKTNGSWQGQIQGLMSEKESNVNNANLKVSILEDELNSLKTDTENSESTWNNKLNENNSIWENKLQDLLTESNDKITTLNTTWKSKFNTVNEELLANKKSLFLSENKYKELDEKTAELSSDKTSMDLRLKIAENQANDAQEQKIVLENNWNTKINDSNDSWNQKVQTLMSTNDNNNEKLNGLKVALSKVEAEKEALSLKLKDVETDKHQVEEKLKTAEDVWNTKLNASNNSWEKKTNTHIDDNKTKDTKLNEVETKLLYAQEQVKNIEMQLNASEDTVKNLEEENKKSSTTLLNSIYEWKQKYKELESQTLVEKSSTIKKNKEIKMFTTEAKEIKSALSNIAPLSKDEKKEE